MNRTKHACTGSVWQWEYKPACGATADKDDCSRLTQFVDCPSCLRLIDSSRIYTRLRD